MARPFCDCDPPMTRYGISSLLVSSREYSKPGSYRTIALIRGFAGTPAAATPAAAPIAAAAAAEIPEMPMRSGSMLPASGLSLAALRASSAASDERQVADAHDWIRRVQGDGGYEPMACHDFVQGDLRDSLEVDSGPPPP